MSNRSSKKERKRARQKQRKLNEKLKKRLFGHLCMAPCYYCRSVFLYTSLTVEHIRPLCLGGTNDPDNITLACEPCNRARGRDAYFYKRELSKEYYEQYYTKHRIENREGVIPEASAPIVHCQGDGI